jgi:alkanesulfonate monooxygenase SsuD/methylene tetrahydromethanopterin reductase-like flavin-dependent oxidoreductase (luciferase family)
MSELQRQLKLGLVTYGVGGPGSPYLWLDEDIPLDASVNVNWYIEQARLAEEARFDLIFIVDQVAGPLNVSRSPGRDLGAEIGEGIIQTRDKDFDRALAELGRPFAWHDFRQYDLDAPFPQQALVYAERGFRTGAEKIAQLAREKDFTLRQTVEFISSPRPTPFAGSPETVADRIGEWFEAGALDGLNYSLGHPGQWHRFREEVVPILQERGLVRKKYESDTLRGNLGLPIPDNRYTKARLAED